MCTPPSPAQNYVDRARRLFGLAATLKRVAHSQRLAAIVTNQASDVVEGERGGAGSDLASGYAQPLGLPSDSAGAAEGAYSGQGSLVPSDAASLPLCFRSASAARTVCIGNTYALPHPGACALHANGRTFRPALGGAGGAWDNCVGVRLVLAYDRSAGAPAWAPPPLPGLPLPGLQSAAAWAGHGAAQGAVAPRAAGVRSAWLLRSSFAPQRAVQFELWPGGARAVGAVQDL